MTIIEKPELISFETIQDLLTTAHQTNIQAGLRYATAFQSVETLKRKIGTGKCFVALDGERLVGFCAVSPHEINYWYYSGCVPVIKLLGVIPDYRGKSVGKKLFQKCIEYAKSVGYEIIVIDSAEENYALKKLVESQGFVLIDYCKYPSQNFISAVYALFSDGCPHSEEKRVEMLQKKKAQLHI